MTSRAGLAGPARVTSPASRRDRADRLGAWGKTLRARDSTPKRVLSPQIGRPSRGSRGASVLETVRARSGGGFSGSAGAVATSDRRCFIGAGSRRLWPLRLRFVGRTCLRRCAPTRKRQTSVRCLCNMPWAGVPLRLLLSEKLPNSRQSCFAHHASFFEVSPRSRGKDELRQGQRPATGDRLTGNRRQDVRSRSVQVSRCWLASSELSQRLRKGSRDCPGYGTTWQGVSLAGRVRDCEVRARVLIVKTDSRGRPNGALRRAASATKSMLGGRSAPRGDDRSSAEGEERFGARWNGLIDESLAAPP